MNHEEKLKRDLITAENNSAWQATLEGDYPRALEIFNVVLRRAASLGATQNRGITRLLAGDAEGALIDFMSTRSFGPSNRNAIFIGTALWLNHRQHLACKDWEYEIEQLWLKNIVYSDAAGGVLPAALLWWGSAHSGFHMYKDVAEQQLKRLKQTQRCRCNWPGPVASFILGDIDENDFLASAGGSAYAQINLRRQCQAQFYIGATYLADGDEEGYKNQLQKGLAEGSNISDAEYHLAHYELKHHF